MAPGVVAVLFLVIAVQPVLVVLEHYTGEAAATKLVFVMDVVPLGVVARRGDKVQLELFGREIQDNFHQLIRVIYNEFIYYFPVTILQGEISNNKACLVRRNGSAYTVVRGNDVVVHTDETLPENMKAPLGMLKLVAVNQFITNVGMRTGENDFALFNQETEDDKKNQ